LEVLEEMLDADPTLVNRRFSELDFGSTGYRRLTLRGATLLHVAAEFGSVKAAQMLMAHGADVNAQAEIDEKGAGGQTPLFHAVSQFYDYGLEVLRFLAASGANLGVRARLPGHYEKPEEFVECTAMGYARLFPGGESETVKFLRQVGAPA
jgi:ankyrin repeat protein